MPGFCNRVKQAICVVEFASLNAQRVRRKGLQANQIVKYGSDVGVMRSIPTSKHNGVSQGSLTKSHTSKTYMNLGMSGSSNALYRSTKNLRRVGSRAPIGFVRSRYVPLLVRSNVADS